MIPITQQKINQMAHEIESNDQVVLGSNTVAWHGLGKVFAGLLSPLRCFAEGVGARTMEQLPVFTEDGLRVDGYKTIVGNYANGARTPLSIVGEDYGLVSDEDTFKTLDGVYNGQACIETAGTLNNGRRIWVLANGTKWAVGGDLIKSYDLWINRHDGSGCFELHRTNTRVVCANTWKTAIGNGRDRVFGVRHTVNVSDGITAAVNLLLGVNKAEEIERAKVQRMATIEMSTAEVSAFVGKLTGFDTQALQTSTRSRNQYNDIVDLFRGGTGNKGATRWDAFNAVTEYVDHARTVRVAAGRDKTEVRFESSLLGSGDAMKSKAFELLTA